MPPSCGEHLQRPTHHLDHVPASGHHEPGQQRLRGPARSAAHPRNPDQPITLLPEVTLIARPAAHRARTKRAWRSWRLQPPTKLDVGIDIKRTEPYDRQRWTASPPPTLPESSPPGGSPTSARQSSPIAGSACCRLHSAQPSPAGSCPDSVAANTSSRTYACWPTTAP